MEGRRLEARPVVIEISDQVIGYPPLVDCVHLDCIRTGLTSKQNYRQVYASWQKQSVISEECIYLILLINDYFGREYEGNSKDYSLCELLI